MDVLVDGDLRVFVFCLVFRAVGDHGIRGVIECLKRSGNTGVRLHQ